MINKILVIDDSDTERFVAVRMLNDAGYRTIEASNGEDGVQKAIEEMPDLILMDVMMPGVTGFQATRYLNKTSKTKDIPIFMLTAKDKESDKAWGIKQGALCYFVKPVNKESILLEIEKLNGNRTIWNNLI